MRGKMGEMDLHVCCRELTLSSSLDFDKLLERMCDLGIRQAGLASDIVAEDEKSLMVLLDELQSRAQKQCVQVFWGRLLYTQVGDFLVFSEDLAVLFQSPNMISFAHCIENGVFSECNAVIWLHPFRGGQRSSFADSETYGLSKILKFVDAIEALNGKDHMSQPELNEKAMEMAQNHGKSIVAGSDVGPLNMLGIGQTQFITDIDSTATLIEQIKKQATSVHLNSEVLGNALTDFALRFVG